MLSHLSWRSCRDLGGVHHHVLKAGIMFARLIRPDYDFRKVLRELGLKEGGFVYMTDDFQSCSCQQDLCLYNRTLEANAYDPNFEWDGDTSIKVNNFHLLPIVDENWEEMLRNQSKEWYTPEELVDRRVEKIRDFLTNGI